MMMMTTMMIIINYKQKRPYSNNTNSIELLLTNGRHISKTKFFLSFNPSFIIIIIILLYYYLRVRIFVKDTAILVARISPKTSDQNKQNAIKNN